MFIDGSPHAVTDLWDVGAHHLNLKFTCSRCGHVRVIHAAAAWWWFKERRWHDHLSKVSKHVYCGECRATSGRIVRKFKMELVKEDETGLPLPMPTEHAWRDAARRRR